MNYTVQVAPEDCTGCVLCVNVCPAKDKANPKHKAINMMPHADHKDRERVNFEFFLDIPELDRERLSAKLDVKTSQFLEPLFEFSGACAGCGETPYLKLLTQLYGDRLLIANATGCSSIYGGNLPSTPYAVNRDGRGPAWSNSLFEDNAEFGLGFRLGIDAHIEQTHVLLKSPDPGHWRHARRAAPHGRPVQRGGHQGAARARPGAAEEARPRVTPTRRDASSSIADYLVRKSVWLVGGDGWAFDIGYGGLDHVSVD